MAPFRPGFRVPLNSVGFDSQGVGVIDIAPGPPIPYSRKRARGVTSYSSSHSSGCQIKLLKSSGSQTESNEAEAGSAGSLHEVIFSDNDDLADDVFDSGTLDHFMNLLVAQHFSHHQQAQITEFLGNNNFIQIDDICLMDYLNQGSDIYQVSWDIYDNTYFHQLRVNNGGVFTSEDTSETTQEFENVTNLKAQYPELNQFMWFYWKP